MLTAISREEVSCNWCTLERVSDIEPHEECDVFTIRYPPAQPVTIIPIATETLAEPKTLPTTVGIVEKNPPFAAPLMMTKAIRGATVLDTGHNTSMLNALKRRDRKSVLSGPTRSPRNPNPSLPRAEEKLKPATKPAPVLVERPSDALYSGRKNGGTKRGKVATAPAMKSTTNWKLRKRRLRIVDYQILC